MTLERPSFVRPLCMCRDICNIDVNDDDDWQEILNVLHVYPDHISAGGERG